MFIVSLFVRCVCAVTCEQHDANMCAAIILILFIVLIVWIAHLRIVCSFACVLCVCACLLACSILIAWIADLRIVCAFAGVLCMCAFACMFGCDCYDARMYVIDLHV